jgi:hypothetical protein
MIFLLLLISGAWADDHPSWFSRDYKSPQEWGFYCEASGKNETEALQAARAQCSSKICLLFGVEVDYQVVSKEDLKSASVNSTTIERCPNVRVSGRIEKKKSVDCTDKECQAFVLQLYPKAEYEKEYQRLNQPNISKTIEKTIVVREGDHTFSDPKPCVDQISTYSKVRGERVEDLTLRIKTLELARERCKNLDYRDIPLANKINGLMIQGFQARNVATATQLNQVLITASTYEEKIEALYQFENSAKSSSDQIPKLKRFLENHYDGLFGNRGPVGDYLKELKSCKIHSQMLLNWPKSFTSSIVPCKRRDDSGENACFPMDILMARGKFLSCICNLGAKDMAQECTKSLWGYLGETCPNEFTPECMKSFSRLIAEKMKMDIRF